jgi:hypothetical protein
METTRGKATNGNGIRCVGLGLLCLTLLPALAQGAFVAAQTLGTSTEIQAGTLSGKTMTFTQPLQNNDDLQTAYNAGTATITLTAGQEVGTYQGNVAFLANALNSATAGWNNENDYNFLASKDYTNPAVSATYDMKFLSTYTGYRTLDKINVFHGWNTARDSYDFDIYYSTTAAPDTFQHIVTVSNSDMNNNVLIQTLFGPNEATDVDTIRFVIRNTLIDNPWYLANSFPEIDVNFQVPEPATMMLLATGGFLAVLRNRR